MDKNALEIVEATRLTPHPQNARDGDVGAIYESIQVNGFFGALVVQRSTGYILAGNHRFLAGCEAGMDAFPVFWVDCDGVGALRILVADNRTSDLATWADDALAQVLQSLAMDSALDGTGFDGDDLDDLLQKLDPLGDEDPEDPDPDTDPEDNWTTVRFKLPPELFPVWERMLQDNGGSALTLVEHYASPRNIGEN